jgi:hypothetical protein
MEDCCFSTIFLTGQSLKILEMFRGLADAVLDIIQSET